MTVTISHTVNDDEFLLANNIGISSFLNLIRSLRRVIVCAVQYSCGSTYLVIYDDIAISRLLPPPCLLENSFHRTIPICIFHYHQRHSLDIITFYKVFLQPNILLRKLNYRFMFTGVVKNLYLKAFDILIM